MSDTIHGISRADIRSDETPGDSVLRFMNATAKRIVETLAALTVGFINPEVLLDFYNLKKTPAQ